ncbi:MAG: hypothetical protein ACFB16_09575 [Phormidesmis sp.]
MTQTVLPQLQEIASELVAQEASLAAQLEEVRGKLEGVRAVLPLFGENGSIAIPEPAATKDSSSSTAAKAEKKATKATAKKTASKQTRTNKKKDGRTASWQKYTRPGVKEKTIPEAVRLVLDTQPDKSFKIAEVMDSLFKEGMPKQQYLKARNRISNILSGGVRDGEWFKGERGTYGLTEKK